MIEVIEDITKLNIITEICKGEELLRELRTSQFFQKYCGRIYVLNTFRVYTHT